MGVNNSLHIASFNAENFYLLLDSRYSRAELEALDQDVYLAMNSSIYNPNKEREKIAEIARVILAQAFDIVGLCEVGGMESLAAFNRIYLHEAYDCYLHEENSRRGIFVGALLKKGRFPQAQARNQSGSFSRNLLRLDLGPEGGKLAVFVVHLKSQFGPDRGIGQRIKEVERLCALARPFNCVVMGDFNGILIRGEAQFEYEAFLALPFRDVLEAAGIPVEKRRTHYHFGKEPSFSQLDYIFCSSDVAVLEAGVLEGEIPLNRAQRDKLPSDHLFIHARILPGQDGPPAAPKGETEPKGEASQKPALSIQRIFALLKNGKKNRAFPLRRKVGGKAPAFPAHAPSSGCLRQDASGRMPQDACAGPFSGQAFAAILRW